VHAHILQIVSAQKGLFSQSITYIPWVYIIELIRAITGPFPAAIVARWVVVDDDQQFKHTTPPAYASAMIRFISLNLSVSRV
jgi:hypothetical protein